MPGYKGKFRCKLPQKYRGDASNIIYRSLKERSIMAFLDKEPCIVAWSSEEIVVPYFYAVDNRQHLYYVDFYMEIKTSSGKIDKYLIEYKPFTQTKVPKKGKSKRANSRYLTESLTYIKNQNKWTAAKKFAEQREMRFVVISEEDVKNMEFFKRCYLS